MATVTAGPTLYDRRVRVIVDKQVIEGLRIQFKVKRTLKKEPNSCEVSISNLNEDSRAGLQQKKVKVIVEAGYKDTIARLFSGDSRSVDQVKSNADWVTKIQCGDGERAYQYRRVSKSYGPGTGVGTVIRDMANSMGLNVIGLDNVTLSEQFTQGYLAYGKASTELDRLLRGRGLEYSIQDGSVQILKTDGTLPNSVILLTDTSGLIGSPEHGNPEKDIPLSPDQYVVTAHKVRGPPILKVKSLLQPGFVPGRKLKLMCQSFPKGSFFRIQTVTHSGDTHGGEWYSELECLPSP